jgi:hypothetical protein
MAWRYGSSDRVECLLCKLSPEFRPQSHQKKKKERKEKSGFRPAQAKKFTRPHLNGKKLGMVVHTCYPSHHGSVK